MSKRSNYGINCRTRIAKFGATRRRNFLFLKPTTSGSGAKRSMLGKCQPTSDTPTFPIDRS